MVLARLFPCKAWQQDRSAAESEMPCITVYKRGAMEVVRRLAA